MLEYYRFRFICIPRFIVYLVNDVRLWVGILGSVVFVGDEYLSLAFRVIGIESYVVYDEIDAERKIGDLIDTRDIDLLVIPESLYIKLRSRHFKFRREGVDKPVLAVVPGLEGSVGKRIEDIYNLISQAVGVRLELER